MNMQANGRAKADGRAGAGGQGGQPALALEGVSSGYKSALVLRDVSLAVEPGLRGAAGQERHGQEHAAQDGDGLSAQGRRPGAAGRRGRHAHAAAGRGAPWRGLCRAGTGAVPDLSIRDNLRLGLPSDRLFDERFADVAQLFPVFASRLRQHAGTLSGGEQKMLLVARGLMQRPALLLLDEITEGLQPSVIDRLAGALAWERERRGTSMFIVEQNVAFALKVADRYLILKQGAIVDQGEAGAAGAAGHIIDHLKV